MRHHLIQTSSCLSCVAGLFLLCTAPLALAQSATLRGGGSTFPAMGYVSIFSPSNSPMTPPATGSMLGVYSAAFGIGVSFCQDGNGYGRKVFEGNDMAHFDVNAPCQPASGQLAGFGAIGLAQPHFYTTEAPLTPTDLANYQWGHGSFAEPVQLPAAMGVVAIAFHKTGVNTLTLTEGQICGLFSGQITHWEDPALGLPGVSGPINVVYPKRSSGTTYALFNHLTAVCPSNVVPGNAAATQFKTMPTFTDAVGNYLSFYAASTPIEPSPFGPPPIDAGSDAEVAKFLLANDGTITFTQLFNAIAAPLRVASIRNSHTLVTVNPQTQFGTTTIPVNLHYDTGVSDTLDIHGRPQPVAFATTHQCIATVYPADYADPSTGYPILALTYLLGNQQGNAADLTAVRQLFGMPYNLALRPQITRMGRITTGYAWLSNVDLTQAKVDSCFAN